MTDSIDLSTIERLASVRGPCVSIYLPTLPTGRGRMEGRIRLKNQLTEAEAALVTAGMRATTARDMTAQAHALLEDEEFWERPMNGLAVLAAPKFFRRFFLDEPPAPRTEVGDAFLLRPLLSLMRKPAFYVLALDQADTRLVRSVPNFVTVVDVPGMPTSIEEIVGLDQSEKQMQMRHVSSGPIMHGAGDRAADPKDRILRFSHAVDRAVTKHLADSRALLVLAADEPALDIYRRASHYRYMAREAVQGSPKLASPEDLARLAAPIVDRERATKAERLAERFGAMNPRFLASDELREVEKAIDEGRVDVLLTPKQTNGNVLDDVTEMQLNHAIVGTLLHGGSVVEIDSSKMPTTKPLAAIYRY
jgi:hypothetical protein